MESNKILTADFLDILFDERNKMYGAYELRRTYDQRVKKALFSTLAFVSIVITGTVLANSFKAKHRPGLPGKDSVFITQVVEDKQLIEKTQEKKPEDKPVQTEKWTANIQVAPNEAVDEPLPEQEVLEKSQIGLEDIEGDLAKDIVPESAPLNDKSGIIENKPAEDPDYIYPIVEIPAKFIGNWEKFLLKNLRGEVPVDNGAEPGRYTVLIQFVVDKEGNVSDIQALSNVGFGMEEEAIRVLKKAPKWEPAIQSGYKVKAYHTQRIVFQIDDN